jgi:hypothetical protein
VDEEEEEEEELFVTATGQYIASLKYSSKLLLPP